MNEESDDTRLEIIKGLLLDEEAIGEATVYKVTVLQSIIAYERSAFEEQCDLQKAVIAKLAEKKPFSPRQRTSLNEGFLEFVSRDDKADCYYVRETAFRWEYVSPKNSTIDSFNAKRVDPSYRVRINITFEPNRVVMTFFGGTESLVFRAREAVCNSVKEMVSNFETTHVAFSPEQMRRMLGKFGKHVALINIDPRDNEKFTKFAERQVSGKAEVQKVLLYDVFNFRMSGIQIVNSPEVARLIKEEGIRLTEISGGLWLEIGIRITCRVKANGRVEFIIPSKHYGNDTEVIYDTAVRLYGKLIPSDIETEKGPLEKYL